ncbi:sensor histidine kinase [Paenibacillus senegalensis]|uniref:sensor histidine kinase n=1 Tax=Paenibacillus senegalensis TaxID=1465766 RepID=UPI000289C43D|nr:histidine kinase [Paenibacillus senegalensis]
MIYRSFWFWLLVLAAMWTAAAIEGGAYNFPLLYWCCSAFFTCYFLTSLTSARPFLFGLLLAGCLLALAAAGNWVPFTEQGYGYLLLVSLFVVGYAFHQLPVRSAAIIGIAALVTVIAVLSYRDIRYTPFFLLLTGFTFGAAALAYRQRDMQLRQAKESMDMQLSEYRELKRLRAQGEEAARHQERTRIARDMHDSVGHKLTALLMQLEVFRLQQAANEPVAKQAEELKKLAQESLKETRAAVMALNDKEVTGMQAILQLIRKWENDYLLQTHFTVRQGVLSLALSNEQSIVIYRTLQEALTNAMRHGQRGTIEIIFEVLGGKLFRCEVINPVASSGAYEPGFGLKVMGERLEHIGGTLEYTLTGRQFILRASFPVEERGKEDDPNIAGRGPEAGAAGAENDD